MAPRGTRCRDQSRPKLKSNVTSRARRDQEKASRPPPSLRLLLVLAVPDDIAHVLVALFLLLDEGGIVHALVLELHPLLGALGRLAFGLLLALSFGIRLLERDEFSLGGLRRHHLFFRRGRDGRSVRTCAGSDRRKLHSGLALRADDRILVEVVELGAAIGAQTFGAELGFRHGSGFLGSGLKIEVLHLASRHGGVNSAATALRARAGASRPFPMTPLRSHARERQ